MTRNSDQTALLGGLVRTLAGHDPDPRDLPSWQSQFRVQSLTFSLDCTRLLSTGADGTVRIWDVESGKQLHCLSQSDTGRLPFTAGTMAPDGRVVVGISADFLYLWDLEVGSPGLRLGISCVAAQFSPDGRLLLVKSDAQHYNSKRRASLVLLNASTHEELLRLDFAVTALGFGFSRTGGHAFSVHIDGTVIRWSLVNGDAAERSCIPVGDDSGRVVAWHYPACFSPDGRSVALCQQLSHAEPRFDGAGDMEFDVSRLVWWDLDGAESARFLVTPEGALPCGCVALSYHQHNRLLLLGRDSLHLWDLEQAAERCRLETGPTNTLALSADGRLAASGCRDGRILLWALPQR